MDKTNQEILERVIKESQRIEEDCLYSGKGHYYAAHSWTAIHYGLGLPAVVIAAVCSATLFQKDAGSGALGYLSLLVSVITAISTFVKPNDKSKAHLKAGNSYNSLKNEVRVFYEIEIRSGSQPDEFVQKLKSLSDRRNKLNEDSAQIPRWAFFLARRGIEQGEATYRV